MDSRKLIDAWMGYIVITFLVGVAWHLVLFKDVYIALDVFSRGEEPIIPFALLAITIQGGLLAYIYPHLCRGGHWAREGIRFGLMMGVFLASSAVFTETAKHTMTSIPAWLVLEFSYYLVQFGLSGLLIGFIYGTSPRKRGKEGP
jgi:hypothetical protein